MAKKDIELDLGEENLTQVENNTVVKEKRSKKEETTEEVVNPLRHERIIVKHIPKQSGMVTNPKHILYGNMAEGATRTFVVPRLSSGLFVNVLTDNEKAFLEECMGLEYNDLSIYKKKDNFWDDSNPQGISKVTLGKQDNYLKLWEPEDYIRYKILLANKDYIAPSLAELEDHPKATYQFVIISEGEETKVAKKNMSTTMQCYKEFGKIEEDRDALRCIIETIDGRPTATTSKIDFLQSKCNDLIQADSKLFLKVVTDPLLSTKVLIKRAVESGVIANRGGFFYYKKDNQPLCEANQDPTLNVAASFLNAPKHQELKFTIEESLK